ncbi:helix-turn-helix domain-containing protein [Larkinella soli]|uniref:helix-turn-helix domain-containing protein n=1 Tax=Larkinella soli TaxID=1770527 RepID=UPI000FFC5CC6|nr:AraC family transcriptional regulator [Larkinella soli]
MTASEYFISVLCGAGVLLGMAVSGILWFRPFPDRLSNRLLATAVFCTSLRVAKPLLVLYATLPPAVEFLGLAAGLLAQPALLLFLQTRLEGAGKWKPAYAWHALPAGLYTLWFLNHPAFSPAAYSLILVHHFLYLGGSIYLVVSHRQAHPEKIYAGIVGVTAGFALILLSYLHAWLVEAPIGIMLKTATLGFTVLVVLLLYVLAGKKFLFEESPGPRYERSRLRSGQSLAMYRTLEKEVQEKRWYLDADLSLPKLARLTGFSVRDISQAINENAGTNLSDWLNGFRIAEARRRLADPAWQSAKIAAIAYDCGFNTLSSFNTVFKAKTARTPSEYRALYRVSPN